LMPDYVEIFDMFEMTTDKIIEKKYVQF
jgi:hypothetical protein